jgi:PGF-CTERM protein
MNIYTVRIKSAFLSALVVASLVTVGFTGVAAAQESTLNYADTATAQESTLDGMDGSGTAEDPYVITTLEELQAMNEDLDAHYVLGNDIDASDSEQLNDGQGVVPVGGDRTEPGCEGPFTGHFDGQNHTIESLTVQYAQNQCTGLFGYTTGTVEYVHLRDATVDGFRGVGVVAGENGGMVRAVSATGDVSLSGDDGGGLVGHNSGTVARSYADVEVSGEGSIGGLVGLNGGSGALTHKSYALGTVSGEQSVGGAVGSNTETVRQVYADGEVSGTEQVGGLLGSLSARNSDTTIPTIRESYSTASVDGETETGALIGDNSGRNSPAGTFQKLYWSGELSGQDSPVGKDDRASDTSAASLSPGSMTGPAARGNISGLTFEETWTATDEYPVHTWAVENVSTSLDVDRIARGDTTELTVSLDMVDGRTLSAQETASYELNNSVGSVADGTVTTSETGTVAITTSIADRTRTETLTVLEPPNISATAASVDADLVARGVGVPIETAVINTGDIAGEDTVSLRIDGETLTEVTVSGEPGVEKNVSVSWRPESLGTYDVAVDDASVGTVEVVEPPELTTESASTNVSAVSAGASVPVSVTIANDDRLRGERNTTLAVDGENVTSELVSVDAGNETTTLGWTPSEPGTYSLAVDGVDAGSITVVPADSVTIENVSVPANATAGEPVSVNVTATNTASVTVSERLGLTVDGETVGATWADLTPNGTTTVTLSAVVNQSGPTTLLAESTSSASSSSLSVLEPASFAITGLDAPSSMTAGSSATVTATVANQGGVAGSQTVTLSFAGTQVTSETVELAAGATTTVTGDISPSSAGGSQVTAGTTDDERTATVTVEAAATDSAAGGTDTSGSSGPGFGVAAAVVAVLAGAALHRRR